MHNQISGDAKSLSSPGSSSGYCSGTEDDQGTLEVGLQDSSNDDVTTDLLEYGRPFFDRLSNVEVPDDITCSEMINHQPVEVAIDDWIFADQCSWQSSLLGSDQDRLVGILSSSNIHVTDFDDGEIFESLLTDLDSKQEPDSDDFIVLSASTFNALVVATAGVDFDQTKFLADDAVVKTEEMTISPFLGNSFELDHHAFDLEPTGATLTEIPNGDDLMLDQLIFADFDELEDNCGRTNVNETSKTLSQIKDSDIFLCSSKAPMQCDNSVDASLFVDERGRTKHPRRESFSSVATDPGLGTDDSLFETVILPPPKPAVRHFSLSSLPDSKISPKHVVRNGRQSSLGSSTGGRQTANRPKPKSRSSESFCPPKVNAIKRTISTPGFIRHPPATFTASPPVKKHLAPGLEDHRYSNRSKEEFKPRCRPEHDGKGYPSSILETVLRSNVRIDPNRGSDAIVLQTPRTAQRRSSQSLDSRGMNGQTLGGSGLLHRLLTGPADAVHMQEIETDADNPRKKETIRKSPVMRSKSMEQTSKPRGNSDALGLGCEFLFEDNIAGLCHLETDGDVEDWMSTEQSDEMTGLDCEPADDEIWLKHCFEDLL